MRRTIVYLDQADWAALERDGSTQVGAALRQCGADGVAWFLVSAEHFVENHGLTHGRRARLSFLRGFPGTVTFGNVTDELLAAEASQLAAVAQGLDRAQIRLEPFLLADLSDAAFEDFSGSVTLQLRSVLASSLRVDRLPRRTQRGYSPEERVHAAAAVRALLRGDVDALIRAIEKQRGSVGRVHRCVLEALTPAVARAIEWARDRGFLGPDRHCDPLLDHCVFAHLPRELLRRRELVQAIAKLWADRRVRADMVPSLAAYAAVRGAMENDLARALELGDLVDARHAAYAPYVDLFTCDKRNYGAVRRALADGGFVTHVMRCGRLEEVVRVVSEAATKPIE